MKRIKQISVFLILIMVSCKPNFKTLSKEDNIFNLTTITNLQEEAYSKKIEDFYNNGKEGTFIGKAGVEIYYKIFENSDSKKAILIASGRTEAAIKYKEVIYDLYKNGYSVYIHDHRGQGLSGRMIDNRDMGYIDSFQFYVDDMKYFYDNFLKTNNYKKVYLLAHSMGGAIGMTYLEQYPNDFNAAAFSSPMLGFKSPSCTVVSIMHGDKPKYALGEVAYNYDYTNFKGNILTGSELRYDRMVDAFSEEPRAKLGGATYQWAHKSCKQFKYIFNHIDKIKTPFLLFSAENEHFVDAYAQQKFIDKAKKKGKVCMAYLIENAQHELLIEKDEQRIKTINEIFRFYANY